MKNTQSLLLERLDDYAENAELYRKKGIDVWMEPKLAADAAAEIRRLQREGDGLAYVIHATNCQLCSVFNRPATICEHGKKLLESARPGATDGMKVVSYA